MDAYLRNGKDGDVDLDSRFHTGANLVDITANRVLQGALLNDDARIRKALQDQFTVFATVDPYNLQHGVTDGYYADGSFIQHASVAYTGSYGKGLLSRVVQTIKVLAGTEYAQSDDLVGVVQGWVEHGFAPLIFEGWMMEIVKGRAVSRTGTGYDDVAVIVEAIVDLADYASPEDSKQLKSFAKFTARATINVNSFVSPVSIGRFADLKADASIVPADLNPAALSTAFNAMDRTVHRRPGYAFALARNSSRISKYEYMSGENLLPWFQGDGAHYLYLAGQDQTQSFGIDYFTTVSPYALARRDRAGRDAASRSRSCTGRRTTTTRRPSPRRRRRRTRTSTSRSEPTSTPAARRSTRTARSAGCSPTTSRTRRGRACRTTSWSTGTRRRPSRGSCSTTRSSYSQPVSATRPAR